MIPLLSFFSESRRSSLVLLLLLLSVVPYDFRWADRAALVPEKERKKKKKKKKQETKGKRHRTTRAVEFPVLLSEANRDAVSPLG